MEKAFKGIASLESLPLWDGTAFSPLEVPERLLQVFGNPQNQVPAIHVAGTNGKGSVCCYLAAMLKAQGFNVGQFASPHLTHVTERCLINGQPAALDDFDRTVSRVMEAARDENLEPSYFVVGAVASFIEFARLGLDWMVIEVGLGGLYDATNLIRSPRASLITNISYDHMHILGDSLESIARNKAGIIKRDAPVFVGEVDTEVEKIIRGYAAERQAPLECMGQDWTFDSESMHLEWKSGSLDLQGVKALPSALHRRSNALLAMRVAAHLGIEEDNILKGLKSARWPGRCELFQVARSSGDVPVPVLLDAAHNSAGVFALVEYLGRLLDEEPELSRVVFVVSMLRRKNWKEMLRILSSVSSSSKELEVEWICTRADSPHAVEPEELCSQIGNGSVVEAPQDVVAELLTQADSKTLIVVCGSIFLVGDIRPSLTKEPFRSIAG